MIVFWLASALLALIALAFVLIPMLRRRSVPRNAAAAPDVSRNSLNVSVYRDQLRELEADRNSGTLAQEDYDRARRELERRLIEDVSETTPASTARMGRGPIVAAIAIPFLALGVYFTVGNPGALTADPHADTRITPQQVEAMVERLAEKLKENPEDAEGWRLLGRSFTVLGRFKEAVDAYARAAVRSPRDAQLLADLADALAMARGQSMQGEPEKLVLRALEIEPANLKALALAGTAAFERKDFDAAARLWERMLAGLPPNSEDARTIQSNVDEARSLSGKKDSSRVLKDSPNALRGVVALDPKLKEKVSPEDTVFIFARAAEGPPMPLAVLKKKAGDLPVTFVLDDSMAMAPGMTLSKHARVVVGARVSKSGSATPQPGDLQGVSPALANNASGVTLTIDKVVP
jgi:cytochrome c-type biogenesis protein CcmH